MYLAYTAPQPTSEATYLFLEGNCTDRITQEPVFNASVIADSDELYFVKAITDESGYFNITIIYPAGTNRMIVTVYCDGYHDYVSSMSLKSVALDLIQEEPKIYGTIKYRLELPPKDNVTVTYEYDDALNCPLKESGNA